MVLGLVFAPGVQASQNEALFKLLEALHANGTIDDATYQSLRQVAAQGAESESAPAPATKQVLQEKIEKEVQKQVQAATADQPKINTKGKFEVTSPDGDFSVQVGGRIQANAEFYDDDRVDFGNGSELRRARLFMSGTLWRVWDYKFEYDFASGSNGAIADAYLAYTDLGPLGVKVGHFKEPFSLQGMSSAKYLNFVERSLTDAFVPSRRSIGAGLYAGNDHYSATLGVFGQGLNEPAGGVDESLGVTGRVTFAPINDGDHVLHLGGALSYRDTGEGKTVKFSQRPESHITNVRLVNTNTIDADDYYRYGLEAAFVYDRLTLQGEYMGASVNRAIAGNPDVDFDGYYLEALWFLTDDYRPYDASSGTFKSVKPNSVVGKGGLGAWQVGARFSSIDLSDGDINGGEEDNFTLGLNWFPNANLRFTANYIKVLDADGGPLPGSEPDIFSLSGLVWF